jgi:hypothetical protein
MGDVTFEPVRINKAAVQEIFKSPAMQSLVKERTEQISATANGKIESNRSPKSRNSGNAFTATVKVGRGTAFGVVKPVSFEGRHAASNGMLDEFLD